MEPIRSLIVPPGSFTPEPPELGAEVRRALLNLALAVNHGLTEEQLKVYAFTLREVDPTWCRKACAELAGTSRFFPKPIEIRERAEAPQSEANAEAARAKLLPLPADADADPRTHYFCRDCRDEVSGWRFFWCPGGGDLGDKDRPVPELGTPKYYCGRKFRHGPHNYVERCACWGTNPLVARKREALAKPKAKG